MTKPMTPDELKAIKARCKAATEGPWFAIDVVVGDGGKRTGVYANMEGPSNAIAYCFRYDDDTVPDGIFIAHARTDLPACTAEIERLRGLVKSTYFEGMVFGNPDRLNPCESAWANSEACKALEAENNKHVWDVSQEDSRFWKCRNCRNVEATLNNQLRNETCKGDKNET